MFEEQLQRLGLTEGEAKVYEALISIGPSTVGPVVKKSGVAYSNIYEILNRLIEKGLASFIIREKTKQFQAVEPTRIKDYLEQQEEQLLTKKQTLKELLPSLEKLKELAGRKQEAEIFVGTKGLMTAYENLLLGFPKNERELFFYIHHKEYEETVTKFYSKFWPKFKMIKGDGICNEECRNTQIVKGSPKSFKYKFTSFPIPGNIDIAKDKVLLITWREKPIGILINSHEVADNFRQYFESVWKAAKP